MEDALNLIKMFLIGPYPNGSLGGLAINIFLAMTSMASGFVLGLFLALGRLSANRVVRGVVTLLIETTRALPLLLIVFWFYFFIPLLVGRPLPILLSVYLSFTFYSAVNQAEIFRGGLMNVNQGQRHVASCTGLSPYQCMRYIILPQVLKMMLPAFISFFVSLFKDTSVAYIIGVVDLTQIGIMLNQREPDKFLLSHMLIAVLYFVFCLFLSRYAKKWEKKQMMWST